MSKDGDDQVELQEILSKGSSSPGRARKGRGRDGIGEESPSPNAATQAGTPVGYVGGIVQWAAEGDGSFVAAGETAKKLPAAAYMVTIDNHGRPHFRQAPLLSDDLVELDDPKSQRVIEGIRKFWTRKARYVEKKILYKRGILMWGPAGSGKTVTLTFLVRDLISAGGLVIYVRSPNGVATALKDFRRIEPDRNLILVFEDIEEIIEEEGEHEVLAILDGEHKVDNVVNLATTNYPERLGPRIINRPSRFDDVVKIGMPSDAMRKQYLEHILGAIDIKNFNINLHQWVEQSKGFSIAHLRELAVAITCLDNDYEETLKRLKHMSVQQRSDPDFGGSRSGFKADEDPDNS